MYLVYFIGCFGNFIFFLIFSLSVYFLFFERNKKREHEDEWVERWAETVRIWERERIWPKYIINLKNTLINKMICREQYMSLFCCFNNFSNMYKKTEQKLEQITRHLFIILFWETVSQCSLGCPRPCSVHQACLLLTEIHLPLPPIFWAWKCMPPLLGL